MQLTDPSCGRWLRCWMDGLEAIDKAVREAVGADVASDEAILNILARRPEPSKPQTITIPEALQLRYPPVPSRRRLRVVEC